MDLEERLAGLLPKAAVDELYLLAEIGEEEYLDFLEGQGWMRSTAHHALTELHQEHAPKHWPDPEPLTVNGFLPPITRPGRKPHRSPKGGPRLSGHPLDEVT